MAYSCNSRRTVGMIAFITLMWATIRGVLASTQVNLSGYAVFTRDIFLINGTFRDTATRTVSQCASLCSRPYTGCVGFLVPNPMCSNNTAATVGSCQLVSITGETVVYPHLGSDSKLLYADISLMAAIVTGNSSTVANFDLVFRTSVRGHVTKMHSTPINSQGYLSESVWIVSCKSNISS
jgi:hypothetical protein